MPGEEYTIRITKNGEVIIESEDGTVQQLRDLAAFLRETMGPVRLTERDGDGGDSRVRFEDYAGRASEEEEERERTRLRDEG